LHFKTENEHESYIIIDSKSRGKHGPTELNETGRECTTEQ